MTAQLDGFQTATATGIRLQFDQRARINLELKVGTVSETLTVSAQAPLIDTETSTLGQVMTSQTIDRRNRKMREPHRTHAWRLIAAIVASAAAMPIATRSASDTAGEWRSYAATNAGAKYAGLDQINKETVKNLRIAWRQSSMPQEVRRGRGTVAVPTNYQVTPLMVGGMLFVSTGDGSVAALNPGTGAVIWTYVPPDLVKEETKNDPPGEMLVGRSANRGVAYWAGGDDSRVIAISGQSLVALNAKTGAPASGFGTAGTVELSKGYRRPAASMRWTSVPLVVGDIIVVGGLPTAPDGNFMPGDVRGYDVRSGKQVWTFNVIPEFGEVGNDTWLKDSYAYSGGAGVWGLMSADDALGLLYIATETPTSRGGDFWGGQRPGNNLFAESLVCLDARTGTRKWHFQAVHHGIWDYDFNAQPNLVDITVDGRRIKAIAEVSKQAFVYVLDRATGQPVWPIVERPVPAGNTPGEWYAPTQPFPTKPPAFDQQGATIDDLIDFTPGLRQEAIAIISQYRYGGLFKPPYGRLVAIDLNRGEILWTTANGDGPRDHPAIKFISVDAPAVVLQHVRVIDGAGAPAVRDQTVVIEGGLIRSIGPAASTQTPGGARVIDLAGRTVMPGWVGMHEHLFYTGSTGRGRIPGVPEYYPTMVYSFPRLYLAAGVTTIKTGGSMEPYADLEVKRYIDAGRIPGPKIHLTGPYLQGPGSYLLQLHTLSGPDDAVRLVNYWADIGFTSFKAYTDITRDQLGAAIKAAHARGLKVTGHLCSVTFREAADLGIDSLEHGLSASTDLVPGKQVDHCPVRPPGLVEPELASPPVQDLIRHLVNKKVAIVSTLPVAEAGVPNRPPLRQQFLDVLSPLARADYLLARARTTDDGRLRLKREMECWCFEIDMRT